MVCLLKIAPLEMRNEPIPENEFEDDSNINNTGRRFGGVGFLYIFRSNRHHPSASHLGLLKTLGSIALEHIEKSGGGAAVVQSLTRATLKQLNNWSNKPTLLRQVFPQLANPDLSCCVAIYSLSRVIRTDPTAGHAQTRFWYEVGQFRSLARGWSDHRGKKVREGARQGGRTAAAENAALISRRNDLLLRRARELRQINPRRTNVRIGKMLADELQNSAEADAKIEGFEKESSKKRKDPKPNTIRRIIGRLERSIVKRS